MTAQTILCGLYAENCYILGNDRGDTLVIDPGDGVREIFDALTGMKRRPSAILLTHGHFDHILGASFLKKTYSCPVYIHKADRDLLKNEALSCYDASLSSLPFTPMEPDYAIKADEDGTRLCVGGFDFTVYHTPGHTPGSICCLSEGENVLYTGDTLFAQGFGRIDLPGGSHSDMLKSLRKLLSMPPKTVICPGHGNMGTIGEAKATLW